MYYGYPTAQRMPKQECCLTQLFLCFIFLWVRRFIISRLAQLLFESSTVPVCSLHLISQHSAIHNKSRTLFRNSTNGRCTQNEKTISQYEAEKGFLEKGWRTVPKNAAWNKLVLTPQQRCPYKMHMNWAEKEILFWNKLSNVEILYVPKRTGDMKLPT